jgi:hypothetical protein
MGYAGHGAYMGERRAACRILIGKPEVKGRVEVRLIDGNTI